MTADDGTRKARSRPGGRSARVVAAVHDAAVDLLREVGYDGLQLPDVAARADVNKTTVYRRWPTKAALVGDLLSALTAVSVPMPDSGTLQGDLELLLAQIAETLRAPEVRAVVAGVLAAVDTNDDVRLARNRFWDERFALSGEIVERGCARGELPAGVDARELLEMACGPVYFRALLGSADVDRSFVEGVVTRTIHGFAAINSAPAR